VLTWRQGPDLLSACLLMGRFGSESASQMDPWGNAMICAKAALAARDSDMRAILTYLTEFWLELALHDASEISESAAIDVVMIQRMQAEILGEAIAIH
jgi:hypothetical protein